MPTALTTTGANDLCDYLTDTLIVQYGLASGVTDHDAGTYTEVETSGVNGYDRQDPPTFDPPGSGQSVSAAAMTFGPFSAELSSPLAAYLVGYNGAGVVKSIVNLKDSGGEDVTKNCGIDDTVEVTSGGLVIDCSA